MNIPFQGGWGRQSPSITSSLRCALRLGPRSSQKLKWRTGATSEVQSSTLLALDTLFCITFFCSLLTIIIKASTPANAQLWQAPIQSLKQNTSFTPFLHNKTRIMNTHTLTREWNEKFNFGGGGIALNFFLIQQILGRGSRAHVMLAITCMQNTRMHTLIENTGGWQCQIMMMTTIWFSHESNLRIKSLRNIFSWNFQK